jgi:hypothetical protein
MERLNNINQNNQNIVVNEPERVEIENRYDMYDGIEEMNDIHLQRGYQYNMYDGIGQMNENYESIADNYEKLRQIRQQKQNKEMLEKKNRLEQKKEEYQENIKKKEKSGDITGDNYVRNINKTVKLLACNETHIAVIINEATIIRNDNNTDRLLKKINNGLILNDMNLPIMNYIDTKKTTNKLIFEIYGIHIINNIDYITNEINKIITDIKQIGLTSDKLIVLLNTGKVVEYDLNIILEGGMKAVKKDTGDKRDKEIINVDNIDTLNIKNYKIN